MTAPARLAGFLRRLGEPVRHRTLESNRPLNWWLIHGPVRSGTTYLLDLVAASARRRVGDWGLSPALGLPPDLPHIGFDRARARSDVSRNILGSAGRGGGKVLDLAYKQAQLRVPEHQALVEMWGPPSRTIFCLRDPSGYLASAVEKFPDIDVFAFRAEYLRDIKSFRAIGGDVLVYSDRLTTQDYREFLRPLPFPAGTSSEFRFQGSRADHLVTEEMRRAFRSVVDDLRGQKSS